MLNGFDGGSMSYVVAGGTKGAPWQGDDGIITEAAGDTSNNDNAITEIFDFGCAHPQSKVRIRLPSSKLTSSAP